MLKMRRKSFIVVLLVELFVFTMSAHADLFNRGTDSQGNRLIYDSDLNITWYDYTKPYDTAWQDKVDWASDLDIDFGSIHYTDWRLPSTVDGPFIEQVVNGVTIWGYDGTTTAGYNITSSEMGHLFYSELSNKGYIATDGTQPQPGYGLTNVGLFQNLQSGCYWSGTEYATNPELAWYFCTHTGFQKAKEKWTWSYAIAVRSGDVAVVPEPISSILFITGGTLLVCRSFLTKNKA